MDQDSVKIHKLTKEQGYYPAILAEQACSIKNYFIIWLLWKFFLWDMVGSPEQARQLHLARSQS